ncbi:hypothetical protein ADK55_28800 [Streptomyces sp. WM4235]|uniref:ABC transporter permease n=1 Tax=Streptomyces sp. WM4235 TaxID=1415551 RepID=UPI0006ADC176|nr:ABC transporter permease [Streptomyces sp. WM4235]KOU41484.1 hypothetical protein ADK55_28800 [Streptomyces sp. WM4235]
MIPPATPGTADVTLRGLLDAVRMEWTKLLSLRSYRLLLALTALVTVTFGTIFTLIAATTDLASRADLGDPLEMSFVSTGLARITVLVLGVLLITSEFGSGQALSTFTAVPRRWQVLAGKATVLSGTVLVVGTLSAAALLAVARVLFAQHGITVTTSTETQVRLVFGSGLQLALSALMALGLGALIRSSVGAIVSVLAVFLVLPTLSFTLGRVQPYLPGATASSLTTVDALPGHLSPVLALVATLAWTGTILTAGAVSLEKRAI